MSDAPWHCMVQQNSVQHRPYLSELQYLFPSLYLLFKTKLWSCRYSFSRAELASSFSRSQKGRKLHVDAPCMPFWSRFPLLPTQNPVLALAHWAAAAHLLLQVQFLILPSLSHPMPSLYVFPGWFPPGYFPLNILTALWGPSEYLKTEGKLNSSMQNICTISNSLSKGFKLPIISLVWA